jgi:signal transduction histidine kinase/ligand-binding sensor domain-containing protein/DNA-binding response OmpR family regulator
MKNTLLIALVAGLLGASVARGANFSCYFVHYSVEDGLPQYSVRDMLQDRKGFMWFATWDGLCRFDGTEFATYKIYPGHTYQMKSSRIDHILEDHDGYLWLQTYDGEVHRFDPRTEAFEGLQALEDYGQFNFFNSKLLLMPSGKLWLLPEQAGGICIERASLCARVYLQEGRSAGRILHVFEDRQDNTWLLTDNGLHRLAASTGERTAFFVEPVEAGASRQAFFCAAEAEDGTLYFGSGNGRIWIFDQKTQAFRLRETGAASGVHDIQWLAGDRMLLVTAADGFFIAGRKEDRMQAFNRRTVRRLPSDVILSAYLDGYQNLWLETDRPGISKFNLDTHQLKHFAKPAYDSHPLPTFFVIEDVKNRVWVHPKGGGFAMYDAESDALIPLSDPEEKNRMPFSDTFHSAFVDRQGNLWLSAVSNGLEKVVFDNNDFRIERLDTHLQPDIDNGVRALFEDRDGNCWVSTKDGKIRIYDPRHQLLGYLQADGALSAAPYAFPRTAYCFMQDRAGAIWIGTKGDGLYRALRRTDTPAHAFRLEIFRKNPADLYSLSDNAVYTLFQDSRGQVWAGTFGGGLNLIEDPGAARLRFIHYRNNLKNYPMDTGYRVRFITEDGSGHICVGTTVGLLLFCSDFASPDHIDYAYFARIPGRRESLSNNDVHHIRITASGEMFIAVFGGGINRVTETDANGLPLRFKSYTKQEGLPSDLALAIEEDADGQLWIVMQNNLVRFDPQAETFQTFGEIKRLMETDSFSEAASLITRSQRLMLGLTRGVLSFAPDRIRTNTFKPYIAFENFWLYNKTVAIDSRSPLPIHIDDLAELSLSHRQNFFTIRYAALDYDYPHNIRYAYMLEGIDSDWQYVQKQQTAHYTNIPRGHYRFRVRSTNSDGVWIDNERSLPIRIRPSFWATPGAYVLYGLSFFVLMFIIVRILIVIYGLKNKVRLEREMSEMKLRFFTDISHEIRTPLTMITAPVDHLLRSDKLSSEIRYHLQLVETNTSRLLRLVNQILDFRKMQHRRLRMEETDITLFVEEICSYFRATAESRNIDFRCVSHVRGQIIVTDKDAVEKILFNLLSNAFKYTPSGKAICVTLTGTAQNICLEVKDEGCGISRDQQKRLFTRFASFNEDKNRPSTGIGLSIVKELASKLKATLSVTSEPDRGSTFTVCLPLRSAGAEKAAAAVPLAPSPVATPAAEAPVAEPEALSDRPSILIVEDDDELRRFLRSILSDEYRLQEAADGTQGWAKACETLPDIIISDIMMPGMGGVELLRKIKNNLDTSHIPVVLLTAKTTIESQLEGLACGADDYITKPFDVSYFRARIRNLLEQRARLQEGLRNRLPDPRPEFRPSTPEITPHDDLFMSKLLEQIEMNLSNGDFRIEDLASTLGVSRSVFFKKVKSLTGLAPVEFVRDIRLQRAAQLLSTGQFSVKEIAFRIGLSDMGYFRKCFRQRFGVNPGAYGEKEMKTIDGNTLS